MIIAIDQSLTGTGLCAVLNGEVVDRLLIKTNASMQWYDRMMLITSLLGTFIDKNKDKNLHVVMEGYAFGGSSKGFVLGELGGCIKFTLGNKGITPRSIHIAHHKMYVTGNSRAEKAEVMGCLKKLFSVEEKDNNIADAISMGLLYNHYLDFKSGALCETSEYQKNIFAKMEVYFDKQLPGSKPKRKPKKGRNRRNTEILTGRAPKAKNKRATKPKELSEKDLVSVL